MKDLYVGYARESVVPEHSVPLAGYGNTSLRMSDNVLDPICATCIALTQGEETVLLYTQDLLWANPEWTAEIRSRLHEEAGVPEKHIFISATHTHSAPDIYNTDPAILNYRPRYVEALVKAGLRALEDRAPSTLYGGKTRTEGMNYTRHYRLANGTIAGSNFGDFSAAPMVDHVRDSDPEMLVVKVAREGKPDILLVNWQAHQCKTGGGKKKNISADFIGYTRTEAEAQTGMLFAYFNGAIGDVGADSRIPAEKTGLDYVQYGQKLAHVAISALPGLEPIRGDGIRVFGTVETFPFNHEDEELAEKALPLVQQWQKTNDTPAAHKMAREHGFVSIYHANATIRRRNRPATGTMELNAFSVGDLAFVTSPCEMFSAQGEYIKANSPFPMTFVCGCANEYKGYLPSLEAFEYHCYEACTTHFARGTGEALAKRFVEMLKQVR